MFNIDFKKIWGELVYGMTWFESFNLKIFVTQLQYFIIQISRYF